MSNGFSYLLFIGIPVFVVLAIVFALVVDRAAFASEPPSRPYDWERDGL